ncbi:MAG: hypothetical protein BVN31_11810 [Proteobacteria bacterium ST_bin15]|nr:MAG: hypothetical protein BVN31_11810 [Proteobacteria bacterium ST_bin15]
MKLPGRRENVASLRLDAPGGHRPGANTLRNIRIIGLTSPAAGVIDCKGPLIRSPSPEIQHAY